MIVPTASQYTSAAGSTTEAISCLTSATGLKGGGGGGLLQAGSRTMPIGMSHKSRCIGPILLRQPDERDELHRYATALGFEEHPVERFVACVPLLRDAL